MLNPKLRIIFMVLGPLFILAGLSKIFSATASNYLFAIGVVQIFLLIFRGGG